MRFVDNTEAAVLAAAKDMLRRGLVEGTPAEVLACRVAMLIDRGRKNGLAPSGIVSFTFQEKAAGELKLPGPNDGGASAIPPPQVEALVPSVKSRMP